MGSSLRDLYKERTGRSKRKSSYDPTGGPNWSGKISAYRFHIQDPIMFDKSIRMTIEHGHNNHRSDDYSSTAYWYQTEPHKDHPIILPVDQRLPLPIYKSF